MKIFQSSLLMSVALLAVLVSRPASGAPIPHPDELEDAANKLRDAGRMFPRGSVANSNTEVSGLPDLASQGVCTCFRKSSRLQSAAR
jgi:hypothetical protein